MFENFKKQNNGAILIRFMLGYKTFVFLPVLTVVFIQLKYMLFSYEIPL